MIHHFGFHKSFYAHIKAIKWTNKGCDEMKEKIKIAFAHNNISHNTEGLMAGISQYIRDRGDWQLIVWPDCSKKSLLFLKERGCKGAFVSVQTTKKAKELLQIGVPVIGVATIQNLLNLPFISANSEEVAQMAGEYLLKKKFENLAFFGLTQARWSAERLEYFSDTWPKGVKLSMCSKKNRFFLQVIRPHIPDYGLNRFSTRVNRN